MATGFSILTNNPLVDESLRGEYQVRFIDAGYLYVLLAARDEIHRGYKLLSHPLSGSVKPNENPYKSLMLAQKPIDGCDMPSLLLIEGAIETYKKFDKKYGELPQVIKDDFMLIDQSLINSAIDSALRSH